MKIYLSSTFEDLKAHRQEVGLALRRLGHTVIGMEDYVAADERPLDKCLKDVRACDVYVGLFAFRYGYVPKVDNQQKRSITELEYLAAADAGIPRLIFLLKDDAPWLPKFVDQGRAARRVTALREQLGKAHLASFFENKDQLAQLVSTAVVRLQQELSPAQASPADPTGANVPDSYRDWVRRECGGIELLGLRLKQGQSVRIGNVYVPLTTPLREIDGQLAAPGAGGKRREPVARMGQEETKPALILNLLDRHSLYVSGPPGTGKSTLCRWLAWLLVEGAMPPDEEATDPAEQEVFPARLAGQLPVLIRLRDFHGSLTPTRELTAHQLELDLARWLVDRKPGGLTGVAFKARLARGALTLIFDGADEVPLDRRQALLAGLAQALPGWHKAGHRILLTSRPYGLEESDLRRLGLPHAPIEKLSSRFQQRLVQRWFRILADHPESARATAEGLLADLRQREELQPLAENPLLLTAMCIVYGQGKRLPQDKHDLYDRIVDTVLHNRFPATQVPLVRNRLAVIAHGMHTGEGLEEDRPSPAAQTTEGEIDRMLAAYQEASSYTETGFRQVSEAREQLLSESGLLLPLEEQRASFYHLSFQEYLAAERIADVEHDRLPTVFRNRSVNPAWRNTLSFLFGSQLARSVAPERAVKLLLAYLNHLKADAEPCQALLVADGVEILRGRGIALSDAQLQRFRELCLTEMRGHRIDLHRAHFGAALGRVGDHRFRADAWYLPNEPLLGFVEIPAGPFRMGSDHSSDPQARDEELWPDGAPQAETGRYFIGRFPVTVGQFRAFAEDRSGNAGFLATDPDALRGIENYPVTQITWHDAIAYCRWLTRKLRAWNGTPQALKQVLDPASPEGGWQINLPSEPEWEKAARGTDGRIYPWGNKFLHHRANVATEEIYAPSAVGCFPLGTSPLEVEEMSGNVFEWNRSMWKGRYDQLSYGYPYDSTDGRERNDMPHQVFRAVRGGSWFNSASDARCAYRLGFSAQLRDWGIGFRIVLSPFRSLPEQ